MAEELLVRLTEMIRLEWKVEGHLVDEKRLGNLLVAD